jgi:heme/copper-type cytochrome/quinol oxidase subunit 3
VAALVFLVAKAWQYQVLVGQGHSPADNLAFASWSVLVGVHWLHVGGGVLANVWVAAGLAKTNATHNSERLHALSLYWGFVDLVWLAIVVSFFI